MAEARAFTSAFREASIIADRALATRGGMDIVYDIAKFGSAAAAKSAARSFTQTFAAMRAQDRKRTHKYKSERAELNGADPALTYAQSPYDKLQCSGRPRGDGSYIISLVRAEEVTNSLTFIDRESGLPLDDMGATKNNRLALLDKFFNHRHMFTREDFDELVELDALFIARNVANMTPNFLTTPWAEWNGIRREDFPSISEPVTMQRPAIKTERPTPPGEEGKPRNSEGAIINSQHDVANVSLDDLGDWAAGE